MIVGGKIFFHSSQQKIWMLMLQERRNLMAECNSIIELAIALRDKEIREAKEAQILKLTEELGYTESDVKKLLKSSKPAEVKPAKKL